MIFQLFYKSTVEVAVTVEDIQNIVVIAKERNSKSNITGCLVYFKNDFYQLLEGNEEDVLSLYKDIKKDKRYYHVTLLNQEKTEYRIFSNWNMALYYLDEKRNSKSIVEEFKSKVELFDSLNYYTDTGLEFWFDVKKRITQDDVII